MVLKEGPTILPSASFTLEKTSMTWKSLPDEGVTEEIKRQTFSKHFFAPRRHKVLMRGILDQPVRDSPVGLLACTRSGDVVVYADNFTFPLVL